MTGSELYAAIWSLTGEEREAQILAAGDAFPSWLLDWVSVTLQELAGESMTVVHELTIDVARDGLRYGTDADQRATPVNFRTAKAIAKKHDGWTFPTPPIVEAIYNAADVQMFMPIPDNLPHDLNLPMSVASARSDTSSFLEMHDAIELQRKGSTGLLAGGRKDLVLTPYMPPIKGVPSKQIFGGRKGLGTGVPGSGWWQGTSNPPAHDELYSDYSEEYRVIRRACIVDGSKADLHDVYRSPAYRAFQGPEEPFDADLLLSVGGVSTLGLKPGKGLPVRVAPANTQVGRVVRGVVGFSAAIGLVLSAREIEAWIARRLS